MGWIEVECKTPNGQNVLHIEHVDDETVFVVTRSQLYRLLMDNEGARLLPVHQFMSPGHA